MTPTEILTLAPLAALTVVFGLFPGLVLDFIRGSVTRTLEAVGRQGAIEISPQAALIAIALPILYIIGRLIWVARIDLTGGGPGLDVAPEPEPGHGSTPSPEAAS